MLSTKMPGADQLNKILCFLWSQLKILKKQLKDEKKEAFMAIVQQYLNDQLSRIICEAEKTDSS